MPAKDTFHAQVRATLVNEGWTITHDPYRLVIGKRKAYIDLAAEMPIAAEKEGRKIAVEIKSFLGQSEVDDLEDALGSLASIKPFWNCVNRNGCFTLPCRKVCANF